MDKIILAAQDRDTKTTSGKKTRKAGLIPAVLYGYKTENRNIAVNAVEFEKVLRQAGESTIIELVTPDKKSHQVLIQDIQNHFIRSVPDHVDFYAVNMSEKLSAAVALEFIGESNAVKAMGGTLVKVLNEVEVECLPSDLPHSIEVDIAAMASFEDVITAGMLKMPANVRLVSDTEEMVAKVQPPRDVEAELATPAVEDVSAVEGAAETKPAEAAEAKAE